MLKFRSVLLLAKQRCFSRRPWPSRARFYSEDPRLQAREADEVDLVIVGAGPAGLAAAIRFKQLDTDGSKRVVVLEKAGDLGAHTLSGAVLEPRALDELLPEWREDMPAHTTLVTKDEMKYLWKGGMATTLPEPPQMLNANKNYVVSLSNVVKWLGEKAAELDVEIYPGFSVNELLKDEKGHIVGVATADQGVDKQGEPKATFERGMEFRAPVTLLGEGCHGSLSKRTIREFDLRTKAGADLQTYGIGLKEVWEVDPAKFHSGRVAHTMGFPLTSGVYGGGFMYHFGENLVSLGLVVGLDYSNPFISPYEEFQKMKTHPFYKSVLEGGNCIAYGARALNEGGYQSIPHLEFPGGGLIGCSAGFVNVPKIKGTHTAMKTGMIAAELVSANGNLEGYDKQVRESWVGQELYTVRNVRPSFNSPLKMLGGLAYSGLDTLILKGRTPWTFHHKHSDAEATKPAANFSPIEYPKKDNVITFDLLTNVSRTGTYHDENEMVHLRVPDQNTDEHALKSWPTFKGVEQRFCPAGVYEYLPDAKVEGTDIPKFRINSQNCIHCKTCDIKVPTQDITWTCPEGGGGPKYTIT